MLARWLYSLLFYAAIPLLLWRLRQRAKKNPGYGQRILERFACYDKQVGSARCLWFHTVSVGEFIAAKPLIDRFLAAGQLPLLITTMTPTGSERVQSAYGSEIQQGLVQHVYLPYDLPDAICRFLNRFNPLLLVIMETELWPNMIHFAAHRNVAVIVANARLSERSAQGYRRILPLFRPMMREVALIAAQSQVDGDRFVDLGLAPSQLQVIGTVKFDLAMDPDVFQQAAMLRLRWGGKRPVFIAASTHEGEDEIVLEAFLYIRAQVPDTLLVIVPRHPERFEDVAKLVQQRGLRLCRHSQKEAVGLETDVVLGDTMGELLKMLGAADVCFMGGSLVPVGGHNMLEPLAMGVPTISGPHVFNFQMVADLLTGLQVLRTVSSAVGLGDTVVALLQDANERQQLAHLGQQVVADNRGAVDRLYSLLAAQVISDC